MRNWTYLSASFTRPFRAFALHDANDEIIAGQIDIQAVLIGQWVRGLSVFGRSFLSQKHIRRKIIGT